MQPLHTDSHNAPDFKNLLVSPIPCADAIFWVEEV